MSTLSDAKRQAFEALKAEATEAAHTLAVIRDRINHIERDGLQGFDAVVTQISPVPEFAKLDLLIARYTAIAEIEYRVRAEEAYAKHPVRAQEAA